MLTPEVMASMTSTFRKLAEEPEAPAKKEKKPEHPLTTVGKGVAAFGVGSALGHGAGMAADALSQKYRGTPMVTPSWGKALPVLAGAGGLAANLWQQGMFNRIAKHQKYKEQES